MKLLLKMSLFVIKMGHYTAVNNRVWISMMAGAEMNSMCNYML